MKKISKWATARLAAYEAFEQISEHDEKGCERQMALIAALEEKILRAFRHIASHETASAISRHILFQFGEPDWACEFERKLGERILRAL